MKRDVSISRDQNTHSLPKYVLVVPIFGSEWESGETSRIIVELDFWKLGDEKDEDAIFGTLASCIPFQFEVEKFLMLSLQSVNQY